MLPEQLYKELKDELDNCANPLFLYDDDPDGLCSFLQCIRYKKDGHGTFVKSVPRVGEQFLRYIEKYNPDKLFILDMPEVVEEFFDKVKIPIVWVDHHKHNYQPSHVKSFNPHDHEIDENNTSTTGIIYGALKQDLWIASVGAIGDWTIPYYIKEFCEKYPDLLSKDVTSPPEALFDSEFSKVINIFSMLLKGDTKTVKNCIKKLAKIKNPYDLINGDSEEAKYILRKTKKTIEDYESLLARALETKDEDGIIVFIYDANKNSFSKEVSNYLQYKNPDKVIIVGRNKSGEYKLSIRAQKQSINPILDKALIGIDGYGGGHEHACGACINEHHFETFITNLKQGFKENKNK